MLGATALLLVGLYLSTLMWAYLGSTEPTYPLLQSRWWWELSLNLQILCFAFMWVCHHERVVATRGWRKVRAVARLLIGMLGVSTPICVLFVCVVNDWYHNAPDTAQLAIVSGSVVTLWALLSYILPTVIGLLLRRKRFLYVGLKSEPLGGALYLMAPFVILTGIALIPEARGSQMHWVIWPLAFYIHAATPYLHRTYTCQEQETVKSLAVW